MQVKRALLLVVMLLALPLAAAEQWFESYQRGVAALNARNYKAAADALQKSIAAKPNDGINVRAGKSLITYVPHFWLGIAKFNLGDPDGALREWKLSEAQGVVARTEYYARMKDWVARAQTEKQQNVQRAAAVPKKAADVAISKALELQLNALNAGADRTATYLTAQRKLQEARLQFQKAGSDAAAYKAAEQMAQQAAVLFTSAAAQGKKTKVMRATAMPLPAPPKKVQPKPATPEIADVITEAEVEKRIAEQQRKMRALEVTSTPAPAVDLAPAYRAFAGGDLAQSEQLLSSILTTTEAAEAYLLRGCVRYTRAMLSRTPEPLLHAAADDFRAALQRNRTLRLDRTHFSPKVVDYFESIRKRL